MRVTLPVTVVNASISAIAAFISFSRVICVSMMIDTVALFFSGSLYILTLLSPADHPLIRYIGPLTPLGGLCFILGWLNWARVVYQSKDS